MATKRTVPPPGQPRLADYISEKEKVSKKGGKTSSLLSLRKRWFSWGDKSPKQDDADNEHGNPESAETASEGGLAGADQRLKPDNNARSVRGGDKSIDNKSARDRQTPSAQAGSSAAPPPSAPLVSPFVFYSLICWDNTRFLF